ncbi:MAG TPA: MarR family transcriptional regulator [Terracidiphilus sp.]|nr:MarR family transcriptional regulator [Terracidiphilus sp.]
MKPKDKEMFEELAHFRHKLRKFLRFSEDAARECGITPQQHQLMLGIAGFTGSGKASISEIADFLQERHNSVVGLVDRAEQSGLVQRAEHAEDRRVVVVSLTQRGEEILRTLSLLHHEEAKRLRREFLSTDGGRHGERTISHGREQSRSGQHSAN